MAGGKPHAEIFKAVLEGGAKVVQLREKNMPFDELVSVGKICREITKKYDASLIVNDYPDIAREIDADGVHIGQADTSIFKAKNIVGENKIVGISTHTREQFENAIKTDADYVAIGPIFGTKSKASLYSATGTDILKWAAGKTSKPIVAIGGINADNIDSVLNTGTRTIAVISAVMTAEDITNATKELVSKIKMKETKK